MRTAAWVRATALFIAAAVAAASGARAPADDAPRPPSILVVLTDDMATGDTDFMPQVQERIARAGVSFSNFLISNPLCCPSRSTFLRGQYAHNHGVMTNTPPLGGYATFFHLGHERSTVATWLQDAGYRTGLFGKYLNPYPLAGAATHVPPGWDDWFAPLGRAAYQSYDYDANHNGRLLSFGHGRDDHLTDVLAERADRFLEAAARDGVPFFAVVTPYAPHEPAVAAPQDRGAFDELAAPRGPSFGQSGLPGNKPYFVRRQGSLGRGEVREIDDRYRRRLESLQGVDRMVGRLFDTLAAAGRLEDTYVLFLSDNGFHLGQHGLRPGKGTVYEEDVRVPLFVRGPGVPRGATIPHLVGNTDLAPTFAAIAGAQAPAFVDGRSILPLLGPAPKPESAWRKSFLLEHVSEYAMRSKAARAYERLWRARADDAGDETIVVPLVQHFFELRGARRPSLSPSFVALRTASLKLVRYASPRDPGEAYLLRADPFERVNRIRDDPLADGEDQDYEAHRLALWDLSRAFGESCRHREDQALPEYP